MKDAVRPLLLAPNTFEHFYRGGARIAALRGIELGSDHSPEEWLAATVTREGSAELGLARTVDGDVVADLVSADPQGWLGTSSARVSDADTGVLVKLLDAAQRLPVHVHPDRRFAASHLDCPYGKTESWYVLAADDDAAVHLGWTDDVDADELARARDAQDSAWMLDRMNRIAVRPGDGILVPAGQVHAIGAGVFVVEAQEPTDFSILLEWSVTTSTRDESHLDLGFDTAMGAVSTRALGADRLRDLHRHLDDAVAPSPQRCLPEEADAFFRVDVLAAPGGGDCAVGAGYAVGVVLAGSGRLQSRDDVVDVQPGATFVVPAGFGDWTLRGDARVVLVRPGVGWPETLGGSS